MRTILTNLDPIAVYGAVLSTLIVLVAVFRFLAERRRRRKERRKFRSDLYFLRKIDRNSKKVHPIVVVLLANLGSERLSFKSLKYAGVSKLGGPVTGTMGWYEQPEELYGIRNRLLPLVLESGETIDLPMVQVGCLKIEKLKIWLTDFDDRRFFIESADIEKVRRDYEIYQEEQPSEVD